MYYYTDPKFNIGSIIIISFLLSHLGARLSNIFMLNSAEYGIPNAHKTKMLKNKDLSSSDVLFYPAYKCKDATQNMK